MADNKENLKALQEAVRRHKHATMLRPFGLKDPVKWNFRANFGTAAWNYRPHYHTIYLGLDILDEEKNKNLRKGLSFEEKVNYALLYINHEHGHGFRTSRDLTKTNRLLSQLKVSFPLFNLFEDARMEAAERAEHRFVFDWFNYEKNDLVETGAPSSMLFYIIQHNGNVQVFEDLIASWSPARQSIAALVIEFYRDIVAAKTDYQLFPILRRWVQTFPQDSQSPNMRFGKGPKNGTSALSDSELEQMAGLLADASQLDSFDNNGIDESGLAQLITYGSAGSGDGDADNSQSKVDRPDDFVQDIPDELPLNSVSPQGTGDFCYGHRHALDLSRADALVDQLVLMLAPKPHRVVKRQVSKRFAIKPLLGARVMFQHDVEKLNKGKKRFAVIVDCSGSMNGLHIHEARLFIYVLSVLAAKGIVSGHVILSKVLSGAIYRVYQLPMALADIECIQADGGGEGLQNAMMATTHLLQEANVVIANTDANITDSPVDKPALHARNIYTTGIYVGSPDALDKLKRHFDSALVGASLEDVVLDMTMRFD